MSHFRGICSFLLYFAYPLMFVSVLVMSLVMRLRNCSDDGLPLWKNNWKKKQKKTKMYVEYQTTRNFMVFCTCILFWLTSGIGQWWTLVAHSCLSLSHIDNSRSLPGAYTGSNQYPVASRESDLRHRFTTTVSYKFATSYPIMSTTLNWN